MADTLAPLEASLPAMYFAELAVILSSCYNIAGLTLHGHRDGLNFLFQEINDTAALFDSPAVQTQWMQQPLDHFDSSENRTWKMRYFQRLDMWKPKGPIYLFMNGEGKATKGFLQTGTTYELARETNGVLFLTEHRYYGNSKPFKNVTTENLKFLSSRQALADNARFLKKIKSLPQFNSSKVVVVGGSYAGNLAAWMKLLYPDLVDAAVASSAPVLAKSDFFEYLETVSDDFEQFGTPGCYDKMVKMFHRYEKLFKTENGTKLLKEEEQICNETDMYKLENKQLFFLDKASPFMGKAQYGDRDSIKNLCEEMNNSRVLPSKEDEMGMWSERRQCYDYEFDNMIESMKETDFMMSWYYQTCTEFGYYQTSNSNHHPFTDNIPVKFYYNMCKALYGPDFDEKRVEEGVLRSNEIYGGLKPNVTHVVFVNGGLDPWHRLSVLEDLSYDAPAKVIPFSSHCTDLFSERSTDTEELKEARKYVKYLVKKWIGAGEFVKIN